MSSVSLRRPALAARLVVLGLVLGALVAGCGFLSGLDRTQSALRQAGYRDVGLNIDSGAGVPPDGLIDVSYSSGPTGNEDEDAANAAHIAWETIGYRFGALAVTRTSGGCLGTFCATTGTGLGDETYAQLEAQFGPRPAGLDDRSAASALRIPLWILIVVPVAIAVIVIAVIVLVVRRRRRPPPPKPPWLQQGPPGPRGWTPPPGWEPSSN